MADDPNIRGQQDRIRINVTQEHEVKYWCKRFDCTPEQLRAVVERVGPVVTDVARALQQQRH
jgi:hypothetical protein